jgi:hypothetical protein
MAKFRIRLTAPVTLAANTEFVMEAKDHDEARLNALPELKRLDDAYLAALREYDTKHYQYRMRLAQHIKESGLHAPNCPEPPEYPRPSYYWGVDDEDIEANLNSDDIDIDRIEEVD